MLPPSILPTKRQRAVSFLSAIKMPLIDVCLAVAVWQGMEYGTKYLSPVKTGFFCNDASIRLPHLPELVPGTTLLVANFASVTFTVLLVELYMVLFVDSHEYMVRGEEGKSKTERITLRFVNVFALYTISNTVSELFLTVSKFAVGRPRPFFLEICSPNRDLNECATAPIYIQEYECMNPDHKFVNFARRSFYSGHACNAMLAAMFLVLYLHARLGDVFSSRALVPLIQVSLICVGMLVGYSRILDHNHHWTDVAFGMAAGTVIAYVMVSKVGRLFLREWQE